MEKEIVLKIFASNLRAERARKNYSQELLSEKAGITTEYLNRIEKEKYNPSLVVIVNLAKALEIDLNTLFPINK